jgi:3-oxoacyl-[acyl-carrier-protein] synthase-1/3-oxoacyl-[acyl-carrier-protein] synthase II
MAHDSAKITITGLGCCCAAGTNTDAAWVALQQRLSRCQPAAADFFAPHKRSPLFTVDGNDIMALCSPMFRGGLEATSLPGINRTIALALAAIAEGLNHARMSLDHLQTLRVGVVLGTTVGCTFHNESYYTNWKKGVAQDIAPVFTYLSANLAERIQKLLKVWGPRAVVTNACASGTDAIGIAKLWLENDMCDIAIAGGADEISRIACHGFSSLMLFSQNPCKPFDADREGLNLGEGAGILILEREGMVIRRRAKSLGWVRGYGAACDAYHPTAPHPQGRGLQQAVTIALKDAGVTMDKICYVNAHGTGTQANDQAELNALSMMVTAANKDLAIVSTKGITGHTLGAAGGIEAVLALTALRNSTTPGTIGCRRQDPRLPLRILAEDEESPLRGRIGMSQSLAFGGGNSVLILEACGQ